MTKVIRIEDGGFVWHVPLMAIAENRADHYAEDPDTTRQEEIDYVMGDDFEGLDWFLNNMDFCDVANVATLVETPKHKEEPDTDNWECNIVEVE